MARYFCSGSWLCFLAFDPLFDCTNVCILVVEVAEEKEHKHENYGAAVSLIYRHFTISEP